MKKSCVYLSFLLVLVLFSVGCAPSVKTYREVAAQVTLPGVKTIAVLPFSGRYSHEGIIVADKISMALANVGHYTIVERNQLDRVLSEQQFSISGLTDESTGANIGKLVNSDAVITGNISILDEKNTSELRQTKKGKIRVYFREVNLTLDIKIILTSTGRLVDSVTIRKRAQDGKDDPNWLASSESLLEKCAIDAAQALTLRICPRVVAVELKLDKGKGEIGEALKIGIEYARNNLNERALEHFKVVAQEFPLASAPLFNQGVMLFLLGQIDEAEDAVNQAIDLYQKSKINNTTGASLSLYSDALNQIRYERQNRMKLEKQKMELTEEYSERDITSPRKSIDSDMLWRQRVRIAVVIPEVLIRRQVPDPAGETKIIQTLIDAGYKPLEQSRIAYLRYTPEVAAAIEDATAAATLARKLKVDVIIIGEAFGEEARRSAGFQSWRARLEARAIYADTQEIICALSEYGSGADISNAVAGKKALENAGAKVGELLIKKLDEYHLGKEGLTSGTRASRDQATIWRVVVRSANIRMEPNTASPVIANAKYGEDLKLLDKSNDWFYIQKADGTEGWIYSKLVKKIE